MEVTKELIDELIEHAGEMAKINRARHGYREGEERFVPVAIVVGPRGEQAVMPFKHRDNDEKHLMMRALSGAARSEGAVAVVLVMDARWANADNFADYFHLPRVEEIGLDKWKDEYHSILFGVYGGSLGDCPREVWEEALVIAAKGPAFEPMMKMIKYCKGEGDKIEWLEETKSETAENVVGIKMDILPDWWEESNGRPS